VLEERQPLFAYLNNLEDLQEDCMFQEYINWYQVEAIKLGVATKKAKESEILFANWNDELNN
jgi:hypothetical protein